MQTTNTTLDPQGSLEDFLDVSSYQGYLGAVSRFHGYSWRNILLIYRQMPHATWLETYDIWSKVYGRPPIRGVKGLKIRSPKPGSEEQAAQFEETTLFDVTQTKGRQKLTNRPADNIEENPAQHKAFLQAVDTIYPGISIEDAPVFETITRVAGSPGFFDGLVSESVAYAVCTRFGLDTRGVSFMELVLDSEELLPVMDKLLETVRYQSDEIICKLEEAFRQACKTAGISPEMAYRFPTHTPKAGGETAKPAATAAPPAATAAPPAATQTDSKPETQPPPESDTQSQTFANQLNLAIGEAAAVSAGDGGEESPPQYPDDVSRIRK